MSFQYVRIRNGCGRRVTLYPHFLRAMKVKRRAHRPRPLVLEPDEVSQPVLFSPLVNGPGWSEFQHCLSIENVPDAPAFVEVRVRSDQEPVELRVKVRRRKKAKPRIKKIRISAKRPRAIEYDAIVNKAEVKKLQRRKIVKLARVAPFSLPSPLSYGYEDDLYVCYECGRPIVFRGSPPIPVHV